MESKAMIRWKGSNGKTCCWFGTCPLLSVSITYWLQFSSFQTNANGVMPAW